MSKGRILVVDDLPDWRKTLSGILFDEGYEVHAAGSCKEALRMLEKEQFHLAVLDVRLDETDEDNQEGLELMRQIRAYDPTMLVIILTGYAKIDMVQEALRPQRDGLPFAYSFIRKEKNSHQELIEFVESAFQHEIRINWDLTIHSPDNFLQKVPSSLRFTEHPKPPIDQLKVEIDELLRKLFFDCEEITLYPLEQGYSGAVVFRVEPRYQQGGRGEGVVTKVGEWPLIEQEERNFKQAVRGVGGHRLPQRLELARTRSLGGMVYSFAGLGDTTGFVEFYKKSAPSEITSVLENLFLMTCFPWGRANKVFQPTFNFTGHYFSHLHLSPAKLQRAFPTLFGKRHCLAPVNNANFRLRFFEHTLINPVEFVLNHPLIGEAYLASVHGDLTGYNVILDHHRETWLIDFGRTGQGLLLQDFASFENFVKLSLLESVDLQAFYKWDRELANTSTLQPPARLLDLSTPDSLSKAHQAILTIRQLAYQISGDDHLTEYLIGLLFHALKLITIMDLKPVQRDLALVSAALVCERFMTDSPG